MKIILTPHGGSGNHGCEAIVRSTAKILGNMELKLFSSRPEEDIRYGLNDYCNVSCDTAPIKRFSANYLRARLSGNPQKIDKLAFAPVIRAIQKGDIMFSIGGDNYCYGINEHILLVNHAGREAGKPTVLWGCSIEQNAVDNDRVFNDLKAFSLIVARESITYNALLSKGLRNVVLYPDPAFQLNRIDLPLPEGFIEGNTLGINLSPMAIDREKDKGMTIKNFVSLIEYTLNHTDMNVALIPHVVWNHNDDRLPLKQLHEHFKHTERVVMIGDYTAPELKGFIARCRFFVAARTHASIAAYSQGVPTLVLGYSVKARGIARDIFGNENNYVLPVQSLSHEKEVVEAFKYIFNNEDAIREHYACVMEKYKAKCLEAKKEIMKL